MSDKDRYIQFLQSIGFTEHHGRNLETIPERTYLQVYNKVYITGYEGYHGFFAWLTFDENGKFINHGVAE